MFEFQTALPTFVVLFVLGLTSPAAALEKPFTQGKLSVSGELDYGVWMGDGDVNAYGFGLGARGGYTLPMNLYLGG